MFFSILFSYPLSMTIPVHSTVTAYEVHNRLCQPVSLHTEGVLQLEIGILVLIITFYNTINYCIAV